MVRYHCLSVHVMYILQRTCMFYIFCIFYRFQISRNLIAVFGAQNDASFAGQLLGITFGKQITIIWKVITDKSSYHGKGILGGGNVNITAGTAQSAVNVFVAASCSSCFETPLEIPVRRRIIMHMSNNIYCCLQSGALRRLLSGWPSGWLTEWHLSALYYMKN